MINLNQGNKRIVDLIGEDEPFLISRLGGVESQVLTKLKNDNNFIKVSEIKLRKKAWINSGIFPPTIGEFNSFKNEYVAALCTSNLIATWGKNYLPNEDEIISDYAKHVTKIPLRVLDPLKLNSSISPENIWTTSLLGLRVLVISSLADSIKLQYSKHINFSIHKYDFLPKFELLTLQAPNTQGLNFWRGSWSKNLLLFKNKIDDFLKNNKIDIALIAAGSYGLPIGNYLKTSGVKSIYMGGSIQLMFGIMGKRWSDDVLVLNYKNDRWLNKPIEKPPVGHGLIEKKAYW